MDTRIYFLIFVATLTIQNVNAVDIWSEGTTYRITPTENMITVKEYTIKAIDFPVPVRGERTISGSIVPETPVTPLVSFELYEDITNNTIPIGQFILGIGDEFITYDKEARLTLSDIPDSMSQDWVYEYYNPWAEVRIQKRGIPTLSVGIALEDENGDALDENTIDSGDKFGIDITVKNTGEDLMKNIDLSIEDPSKMLTFSKLKGFVSSLEKDEEKGILDTDSEIPKFIEEKEYEIFVNVSWEDIKYVKYFYNTTKKIKTRNAFELLRLNKTIAQDSIYLREYETVVLSITNYGNLYMNDIRVNDSLPTNVVYVRNNSLKKFFLNKSSIGPKEAWSFDYILKPLEPGIYILPKFNLTFSMLGRSFETESNEAGFRVFGPKVILTKTAKRSEYNKEDIEVYINAKNIGNGFTKMRIEDTLPDGGNLISGKLNLTTSLDPGKEKVMNYTVRLYMDNITDNNIVNIESWPPAKATYFLDDYKFTTLSNESIAVYEQLVWSIEPTTPIFREKYIGEKYIEKKELEKEIIPAVMPEIEIDEVQKRVVATIPAKPVKTPEKGIPGFRFYHIGISFAILILLLKIRKKLS